MHFGIEGYLLLKLVKELDIIDGISKNGKSNIKRYLHRMKFNDGSETEED